MKKIIGIILLIGGMACENQSGDNTVKNVEDKSLKQDTVYEKEAEPIQQDDEEELSFDDEIDFVKYCVKQIHEDNQLALEKCTQGTILFSPYAYIDTASARKVPIYKLIEPSDEIHYWGDYDARGDAIDMTTTSYLKEFVFNFDLEAEEVSVNIYDGKPKAYGSELHNVHKLYPDAKFVEFYHPPSKEGYLDWNALIFVVEESVGDYILKAIIHNQWTA